MSSTILTSISADSSGIHDAFATWANHGATYAIAGKVHERAINLDDGYLTAPIVANTLLATQDYTISFWNYKVSTNCWDVIFGYDADSIYSIQNSDRYSSGNIGTRINSIYYSISGEAAPMNKWFHVAIVNNVASKVLSLFVNGVLKGTIPCIALKASETTMMLGNWGII